MNSNNNTAETKTGKDSTPIIAVTKKAHIVSGNLVIDIPLVLKFNIVTI